jgi:hypothetical protein
MTRRIGGAAAAIAFLLIVGAGTALAGGWAQVTPDQASGTTDPKAGEPIVIGFTVMQHGITPAPWEQATVVASNALTGDTFDVPAVVDGTQGHFTAKVTFPEAGIWSWSVKLASLEVEGVTTPVTVLTAAGVAPTVNAATALRLANQAAANVETRLASEYGARIDALQQRADDADYTVATLRSQVRDVLARAAEARSAGSAAAASGAAPATAVQPASPVPPAVLILTAGLVAVLAGAATAFVIVMLGRPSAAVGAAAGPDGGALPDYAPTTR